MGIKQLLNEILQKSNPRFASNVVKMGKPGVGIENGKYSLYFNFIDKTYKIYLFTFV